MHRSTIAAALFSMVAAWMLMAQPALSETATPLSGQQIKDQLVGNTIIGTEDGEPYSEFLKKDGTISGQSPSEKYTGQWRIGDDQICFYYKEEGKSPAKAENWDCTFVVINGDKVIWQGTDSPDSTLLAGNPKGL
jgi:hypothetical protein